MAPPEDRAPPRAPEAVRAQALELLIEHASRRSLHEVLAYAEAALGERAGDVNRKTRLLVHPSPLLSFAAGDVRSAQVLADGRLEVIATFLGLYGASSPLPPNYLEHLARISGERRGQRVLAFLDVFHQRSFELLHRAHRRFRVTPHERPEPLLSSLQAFVGLLATHGATPLASPALAPGFISKNRSAQALERMLSRRLQRPVRVEQLEARSAVVPQEQRSTLGAAGRRAGTNTLGSSFLLGRRVRDRSGLSIHLSCTDHAELVDFAPGGAHHARIAQVVQAFVRTPASPRLALHVASEVLPRWQLGRQHLGRDTWLGSRRAEERIIRYGLRAETTSAR